MPTLGPNISAHRFLPDIKLEALNSKYSLALHIFEWGIFNDALKLQQKCPNSTQSGQGGCQPASNIFPLANKFAEGKMFWNLGQKGINSPLDMFPITSH